MGIFNSSIRRGVRSGLESAFGPDGTASRSLSAALDEGLAPLRDELARLRRIERRYKWHPMESAPAWLKDGRPVLVNQSGDFVWACWVDDDDGGWWDADLEQSGEPLEPPPTHFFLVPSVVQPNAAAPAAHSPVIDGESSRAEPLNSYPSGRDQ